MKSELAGRSSTTSDERCSRRCPPAARDRVPARQLEGRTESDGPIRNPGPKRSARRSRRRRRTPRRRARRGRARPERRARAEGRQEGLRHRPVRQLRRPRVQDEAERQADPRVGQGPEAQVRRLGGVHRRRREGRLRVARRSLAGLEKRRGDGSSAHLSRRCAPPSPAGGGGDLGRPGRRPAEPEGAPDRALPSTRLRGWSRRSSPAESGAEAGKALDAAATRRRRPTPARASTWRSPC